ncbi:metallophosphoesterase [Haloechinothrix salitolerans]|uniref:Metallophosphoesterase family protein n=1 Tax=Haloechinothrix salitolerans TaxID=926830 RepID=A0ABW2BZ51_9PSEU
MRLAIFSDVHGNLPAIERMLTDAGAVDGYICLGDTVNYGPWSNECADLVASLPNVVSLRGNHEEYFLQGRYFGNHSIAREFFSVCYETFDRLDAISNLPSTYTLNGFVFSHTIKDQYIFADTPISLECNYVIGHSHRQFKISQPPFILYNPGSVGQNRQYINVINYLVADIDDMTFDLRSVLYDERVVIREMLRRHYPDTCISYYAKRPRL